MSTNVYVICIDCVDIFEATVYKNRVEFSHLITQTSLSTVSTNNIAYTIHNSIALILCIDHLDMPFNVHTTDKVTVSGFLTI